MVLAAYEAQCEHATLPLSFYTHVAALEEGKGLANMCTESGLQRLSLHCRQSLCRSAGQNGARNGRPSPGPSRGLITNIRKTFYEYPQV